MLDLLDFMGMINSCLLKSGFRGERSWVSIYSLKRKQNFSNSLNAMKKRYKKRLILSKHTKKKE